MTDRITMPSQGIPSGSTPPPWGHLGRVLTVTFRGRTEVATVCSEGVIYPNNGSDPDSQNIGLYFPDTKEYVTVSLAFFLADGEQDGDCKNCGGAGCQFCDARKVAEASS